MNTRVNREALFLRCSVNEGHDLGAGAELFGAELTAAVALGNACGVCPQYRIVISVLRNVREGVIRALRGRALVSPQEGHELCSRAAGVGLEGVSCFTGRDTLLHRPEDGLVIRLQAALVFNIAKWI